MPITVAFSPPEGGSVDPPALGSGEVHLWACGLDLPPERIAALASVLSPEERARASRYRFARHRRRYQASQGVVRSLLGAYANCPPDRLAWRYGPSGKPALADEAIDVEFNLSHSADQMLLGVQRGSRIGVDLERLRDVAEWRRIAERVFCETEVEALESLAGPDRIAGFLNCWTRKEALTKAHGEGVFASLGRFEVSLQPGTVARLHRLDGDRTAAEAWSLHHLEPTPGYVGALATDLPRPAEPRGWTLDALEQRLPGIP